ncbi:cyclic nucleotide-binding/CBS domain-containing protein [Halobium palmae]|uniref:Cyclic nucleotide-binding/CBS domain-containing protein n=1 Tax=Halobium palmae TaxID=1776492 RepID=A0ABD5RX61_9EURY
MEQNRSPVGRLMTDGVLSVQGETPIANAAATLVEEDVGSLVVRGEDGRVVGVFTNTDLAEFVAGGRSRDGATVAEFMTDEVVTIGASDSLTEAAAKMIRHEVHHLPVTDDEGEIVGMLSTMDLTAHFSYTGGSDMV